MWNEICDHAWTGQLLCMSRNWQTASMFRAFEEFVREVFDMDKKPPDKRVVVAIDYSDFAVEAFVCEYHICCLVYLGILSSGIKYPNVRKYMPYSSHLKRFRISTLSLISNNIFLLPVFCADYVWQKISPWHMNRWLFWILPFCIIAKLQVWIYKALYD